MKKTLSILTLFFLAQVVFAQSGNLDNNTLNIIRSNYSQKAENDIAIRNALTNNDIRNLALNRDVVGKETHDFKYKVKVKGITDQKSSGRCWMFTGLNILRPQLIDEKKLSNFELPKGKIIPDLIEATLGTFQLFVHRNNVEQHSSL